MSHYDLIIIGSGPAGRAAAIQAGKLKRRVLVIDKKDKLGGVSVHTGTIPSKTLREMIVSSIDVIVQAQRLRDGSRRITHVSEVMGMAGDVVITQDVFLYDILGEDANGKLIGRHRSTGIGRPKFWEKARYFGEEHRLAAALDAAEVREDGNV